MKPHTKSERPVPARTVFRITGAVLLAATLASTGGAAPADRTLFDGLRGAWLGTLRADAPVQVIEERDGWRRVLIEAWMPVPGDAPPGGVTRKEIPTAVPSGGVPVPAPGASAPDANGRSVATAPARGGAQAAAVRGTLLPVHGLAETPGIGLAVLLVGDLQALDREHARASAECGAELARQRRAIDGLREERERALMTIDNFREAVTLGDRYKERILEAEKAMLRRAADCRARAEAIYDRHAVARTVADSTARFEFPDVTPGRYRVVALDARSDPPRAWSMECTPAAGETRVVDPRTDRSPVDPYWRGAPGGNPGS